MANGVKTFTISINGLTESISAVESLNKQLGLLESKINALSSKAVNISSSSGGGGSRSGALSEEEKLQKQIAQTEEKRIAYQKDIYQTLLAEKDLLKETVNDQKQVAAQERLTADAYSNTMQGMKDKLADIKAVMQTVDLGDVDTFQKLTNDANELNAKLLEIEKSYGQFGRNVGNYASAFDGLKNIQVTVGNTVREFGSAREAFRTLGEELKALSINGQANTKHADELREAYNKLKSAMDDATLSSKAMDEAMDWMQSFTSMASVGQGFKGFFGIGGDEIQRSIQKLVSLQNVLQGIEKINKQIDSGEGFGKYIGSLNKGVDKVTNRLLAFNRSLNGTGTYAKAASVAIKGFGMALKAVGVGLAITAISKLVDAFSDLFSSSKKVEEQNKRLQQSFDVLTSEIDRRNEALDAAQQAGIISEQEKLTAQFDNQLELLDRQVELLERRADLQGENIGIGSIKQGTSLLGDVDVFNSKISFTPNWGGAVDTVVNNMEELTTLYGRYTKALEEADKANEEWATALTLSGEEIRQNTEYYQNMRNQMEKMAFGHYVSEVQKLDKAYKDGRISAEFYEKKMKDLKKAMEVDQAYQNALVHMKDLFGENAEAADALAKSIDNIFRSIQRGDVTNLINIRNAISGLSRMLKTDLENAYDDIDQWEKEQINNITGETEAAEEARTAIKVTAQLKRKKLLEEHQKEELEEQRKTNEKALSSAKEYARNVDEAERDLINLRIQNMKEGLNKVLAQLEEERKAKLQKVIDSGKLVGEREEEINKLYDKKIEDAKKEHLEREKKAYKDANDYILSQTIDTQRRILEILETTRENNLAKINNNSEWLNQNISSYGIQGKNSLSQDTRTLLQIVSQDADSMTENYKKLFNLQREAQTKQNILLAATEEHNRKLIEADEKYLAKKKEIEKKLEELEKEKTFMFEDEYNKQLYSLTTELDKAKKEFLDFDKVSTANIDNLISEFKSAEDAVKEFESQLSETYSSEEQQQAAKLVKQRLAQESYSKDLSTIYKQRSSAIDAYWQRRISTETKAIKEIHDNEISLLVDETEQEIKAASGSYITQMELLDKQFKETLITQEQYNELSAKTENEYKSQLSALTLNAAVKAQEIEKNKNEEIQKINSNALQARLQEFRDFTTAINELESKQPVMNVWGTTNFKETNKNNRELLDSYVTLSKDIVAQKEKLQQQLNDKELSFDDFQNANRELDRFTADLGVKMDKVKYELSLGGQIQQFAQDMQQYIQEVANAASQIMSSIWSYQDNVYDRQVRDIEKQIDAQEKLLDKQKDMIQKHADAVNSIEDELSSARGDRRQHLIDQLNQEIAAQRAAAEEEKQLEKKKEALEKQKEKMAKDQWEKEKARNITTALMNAAMAVSQAAANNWPIPAIPLIALATAVGAAQVAAIEAQRYPYAKGGLLEGPSHSQGGIPVGNTGIEVEGQEYVIRKKSTKENVPVLDFINKSERKLTLDDFIDFYSTKPRATIKNIKSKFADGGVIPSTSSLDIGEQLQNIVINQDNRPIYVSVVDINNKQADVRRVQALAGL